MNEREEKAFETFIVSKFRKAEKANFDFSQDVNLSSKEKAALAGIPSDFLDLVISGKYVRQTINDNTIRLDEDMEHVDLSQLVLNRADDIDETDAEKLDENERKLIERKLQEKRDRDESGKGS